MPANTYTRGLRGPIFWLLLATAVAVLAPTAHMLLDGGPAGVVFWLILAVLMVSLLLMRVRLTVADDAVTMRIWGFNNSIPVRDITQVGLGPSTRLIDGADVRLIDNADAYVVTGPTVRINAGAGTFLVSAENPEEVVADIERRRAALHG